MDIEIINDYKEVEQRSDEWFKARLGRITGSKFPSLMPSSRQKEDQFSETQLKILKELAVERMTGEKAESFSNQYIQWGIDTELEAKEYYESLNWCKIKEIGFIPFGKFGDSPDGTVEGEKAIEIKCPKSTTHLDYLMNPTKLLNMYKWQCYGHMIATELKECDLFSYDPRFIDDKQKIVVVNIKYDKLEAEKLLKRLELCESKIEEYCNAKG